ncbi:NAD(P)-dependent oxidoreductase [Sphingomonas sp.]|uniref:NAD(P)-dependent oxidoreductase n=1 Tax=Sphingomonas sp. TaxID=28214 RepID=UPI003FA77E72
MMASDIKRVGFVGLGSLGAAQVRELAKLPLELIVHDVRPEAMAEFEGRAQLAGDIAEAGRGSDVVAIAVQNDEQVDACADALLPVMKRGAVLMLHSTIRPATVIALAERAAAVGVDVLEAPVTRTEMTRDGPFVYCITGGSEALAGRLATIIAAFATDQVHAGPHGSAMALKTCNNLVSWGSVLATIEAIAIAEGAGVPVDKLLAVMTRNRLLTPAASVFLAYRSDPGDAVRRASVAVQGTIAEKDVKLAQALAAGAGVAAPLADKAAPLIRDALVAISKS